MGFDPFFLYNILSNSFVSGRSWISWRKLSVNNWNFFLLEINIKRHVMEGFVVYMVDQSLWLPVHCMYINYCLWWSKNCDYFNFYYFFSIIIIESINIIFNGNSFRPQLLVLMKMDTGLTPKYPKMVTFASQLKAGM